MAVLRPVLRCRLLTVLTILLIRCVSCSRRATSHAYNFAATTCCRPCEGTVTANLARTLLDTGWSRLKWVRSCDLAQFLHVYVKLTAIKSMWANRPSHTSHRPWYSGGRVPGRRVTTTWHPAPRPNLSHLNKRPADKANHTLFRTCWIIVSLFLFSVNDEHILRLPLSINVN
jgi:hypothetical protein